LTKSWREAKTTDGECRALGYKASIMNDQLSAQERDQEGAREIELYAEGQRIQRTPGEIAAEEAEIAEVRERWVRLKRAYLGEL